MPTQEFTPPSAWSAVGPATLLMPAMLLIGAVWLWRAFRSGGAAEQNAERFLIDTGYHVEGLEALTPAQQAGELKRRAWQQQLRRVRDPSPPATVFRRERDGLLYEHYTRSHTLFERDDTAAALAELQHFGGTLWTESIASPHSRGRRLALWLSCFRLHGGPPRRLRWHVRERSSMPSPGLVAGTLQRVWPQRAAYPLRLGLGRV